MMDVSAYAETTFYCSLDQREFIDFIYGQNIVFKYNVSSKGNE